MAEGHEDQLRARLAEVKARIVAIDQEYIDSYIEPGSDDGHEYNALNAEHDELSRTIAQRDARRERIAVISGDTFSTDADPRFAGNGGQFNIGTPMTQNDVYDLSTLRATAANGPGAMRAEMHERSHRAIDRMVFPQDRVDQAACKESITRILATVDDEHGSVARRVLTTSAPAYKEAFSRWISTGGREIRADLELGVDADGGFAVPVELDPTLIPTSADVVNPYRAVSKIVQSTAKTWEGVTTAGVTATRRGEIAETTDGAPTLAQPTATANRVDVFIPYSIDLQNSWGGMQGELASLIQDAKDAEEVSSFTSGTGTVVPEGILVGALSSTILTAGTAAFASVDLDSAEDTLGPRFRQRAVWMGNRTIYNKIRHFDAAGGPDWWLALAGGLGSGGSLAQPIHGYPAYENSSMATALTTGTKILVLGDFSRYFLILDKIGLNLEFVPHLFGGTANYPTGQRGLFAYWWNTSKVLSASAFVILKTL